MRDRLIELIKQGDKIFADKYTGKVMSHIDEIYDFIADYLLENGVIVPPCKVGDIVWVNSNYGTIPAKVYEIAQTFYGSFLVNLHYDLSYCYRNNINTNGAVGYTEDKFEFGKTAYHTKEEAEQALSKLQASYEQGKEGEQE